MAWGQVVDGRIAKETRKRLGEMPRKRGPFSKVINGFILARVPYRPTKLIYKEVCLYARVITHARTYTVSVDTTAKLNTQGRIFSVIYVLSTFNSEQLFVVETMREGRAAEDAGVGGGVGGGSVSFSRRGGKVEVGRSPEFRPFWTSSHEMYCGARWGPGLRHSCGSGRRSLDTWRSPEGGCLRFLGLLGRVTTDSVAESYSHSAGAELRGQGH